MDQFVLKIRFPKQNVVKSIRINVTEQVSVLKKVLADKIPEVKDVLNYAVFLHGEKGKNAKFLDDYKLLGLYGVTESSTIEFTLKARIGAESDVKKQKKLTEDILKGNLDRLKEKCSKTTEFNYWMDAAGTDTPLTYAITANNAELVEFLVENGAWGDFRLGDGGGWKTPLHISAEKNKPWALQLLLRTGVNPNIADILGLTPLYYAATTGSTECVIRLLLMKANTEVFDDTGKGPLHQATLKNYDCIVALLIDFGANMTAANLAGNTPLQISSTRNSKECVKWLLLRGADPKQCNKSGKNSMDLAEQSGSDEVLEILTKWNPDDVVPPPPKLAFESCNADEICYHVLKCLTESIGGEYKQKMIGGQAQIEIAKQNVPIMAPTTRHKKQSSSLAQEVELRESVVIQNDVIIQETPGPLVATDSFSTSSSRTSAGPGSGIELIVEEDEPLEKRSSKVDARPTSMISMPNKAPFSPPSTSALVNSNQSLVQNTISNSFHSLSTRNVNPTSEDSSLSLSSSQKRKSQHMHSVTFKEKEYFGGVPAKEFPVNTSGIEAETKELISRLRMSLAEGGLDGGLADQIELIIGKSFGAQSILQHENASLSRELMDLKGAGN